MAEPAGSMPPAPADDDPRWGPFLDPLAKLLLRLAGQGAERPEATKDKSDRKLPV